MAEIKVIISTEPQAGTLNREELTEAFSALPNLSIATVDQFVDQQIDAIAIKLLHEQPELNELLLRKIVQFSRDKSSDILNHTVIPISDGPGARSGGAPEQEDSGIIITFDSRAKVLTSEGLYYIAAPGQEIKAIGIQIFPLCSQGDEPAPWGRPTVAGPDILLAGAYDARLVSQTCESHLAKPNYALIIAGREIVAGEKIMFEELNASAVNAVLRTIFQYLVGFDTYHDESGAVTYAQLHDAPVADMEDLKNHTVLIDNKAIPALPETLLEIEKAHFGRFRADSPLSIDADIDLRGFSRAYQLAILRGRDSDAVVTELDRFKQRTIAAKFHQVRMNHLLDEKNKLGMFRSIIEKKLGPKTLAIIDKRLVAEPSLSIDAKKVLDLLKPADKKLVELEYAAHEKFVAAELGNKCQHVKTYRAFRKAQADSDVRKYYKDLGRFMTKGKSSSMITCSVCGFDLICPHIRDLTDAELAKRSQVEIKAKLTQYIAKASSRDLSYCKICGELMTSDVLEVTDDRDPASSQDEELRSFMWGEVGSLIKFMKFGPLVDIPRVISAARDACYPFIFEIDKQIMKSKTNSTDEANAKKRLYVAIYAAAYFVHLALTNPGEISLRNSHQAKDSTAAEMIKYFLLIILSTRNVFIREIPGMSEDSVKNILIEAYKSIRGIQQTIIHADDAEDMLTTLLLDPVYNYLYRMNMINDVLVKKRVPELGHLDHVDRLDHIMGANVAQLEKSDDVFGKITLPKFGPKWNLPAFDDIKWDLRARDVMGPTGGRNARAGYAARSFESFIGRVKSRSYLNVQREDIPSDDSFEKKEKIYQAYEILSAAQTYNFLETSHSAELPKTGLGRLYDEDGTPHKFDILVCAGTPPVDIRASEVAKTLESGKRFTEKIIDRKCSVCGVLRSMSADVPDDVVIASLKNKRAVDNFFRFYEYRCPEGGLHEMKNGVCVKCELGKDNKAYYKKYNAKYSAEMAAQSVTSRPEPALARVISLAHIEEYRDWVYNFNVVLELANSLSVNHQLILVLGAIERQPYAEVKSGKFIPREVEDRYATRILLADSYVKNLMMEYNQLRYFHRLVKPPYELANIVAGSGLPKHRLSELVTLLPEIYDDYTARFTAVQMTKKPKDTLLFCIQTLCEKCLLIFSGGSEPIDKLRKSFVVYFMGKILKADELLTKPGYFNWSLLYGDREDTVDKREYAADDDEGPAENTGISDDESPFAMDAFDVDIDPDADPDDDQNDVRVGEDLGLT